MTDSSLEDIVAWVLSEVAGDRLVSVTGLREGGPPWLVRYATSGGAGSAVVRIGAPDEPETQQIEARALELARAGGIPAPGIIACRADEEAVLLLVDYVDGSSHQPVQADPSRLEALGVICARISLVDPGDAELPDVLRPIRLVDFDELRAQAPRQDLLETASERVAGVVPEGPVGFVHGDLWSGNTLWRGGAVVAVVDWDCAGVGAAGVDLGSLRCDAAMCYGMEAADHVLAGWQREAGRPAESLAYWDVVAALSTPPDIDWFAPSTADMTGRSDLTKELLRERRDAFLATALEQLS